MQDIRERVALASGNAGKLREMRALLSGRFEVVSMREAGFEGEINETGETFAENARIKAEAVMRATGMPAIADDSGLAVDALCGAPGVRSARYAGAHGDDGRNNALLMENMKDVPDGARQAKFVCAMAFSRPDAATIVCVGECHGVITRAPRGTHGFGYDPYFEYENGLTFAQIPDEEKNAISHRARASAKLLAALDEAH